MVNNLMENYLTNASDSKYNNISNPSLTNCTICPRNCHVNRNAVQTGYCGQTSVLRVARAALHFWEEPCISGNGGSGTVFFVGCNLGCIFCQNHAIAHINSSSDTVCAKGSAYKAALECSDNASMPGKEITIEKLAQVFLSLQDQGAHNINLVTPSHFVPQIACALELAKSDGLHLPIVYNTSTYEKVETLKRLDGLIDIYLPDLKFYSGVTAGAYANAPDYFPIACAALAEMYRQVGNPTFENKIAHDTETEVDLSITSDIAKTSGMTITPDTEKIPKEITTCVINHGQDPSETLLMKKGVIVRHLLLPGHTNDSCHILQYLYKTYGNSIYISIMNQYTPMVQTCPSSPLNRKVTAREYDKVIDYAISLGITNAFIQEGPTASESFIPSFDGEGLSL